MFHSLIEYVVIFFNHKLYVQKESIHTPWIASYIATTVTIILWLPLLHGSRPGLRLIDGPDVKL